MVSTKAAQSQFDAFFGSPLEQVYPEIFVATRNELGRNRHEIELIASERNDSRPRP